MLKHPNLCRPFYRDCKNELKEIITGTNTSLPDVGFSQRDKVVCAVRGAVRYLLMHAASGACCCTGNLRYKNEVYKSSKLA